MLLGATLENKVLANNPFNFNQQYLEFENDSGRINIACVASMICFHKSQDLLLSVFGQQKWKQRNLCLNLYGDGINLEQLKRLVELYDLENHVCIRGFETDKVKNLEKRMLLVLCRQEWRANRWPCWKLCLLAA